MANPPNQYDVRIHDLYPHERDYNVPRIAKAWKRVVDAADYDALAASVEYHKDMATKWQHEAELDLARIRELEASMRKIDDQILLDKYEYRRIAHAALYPNEKP